MPAKSLPLRRCLLALSCLAIGGCLFTDPGPAANEGNAEASGATFDAGGAEAQPTTGPQATTEPQATDGTGEPMLDCKWEQVVTSPRPAKRIDAALALGPGGAQVLLYGGRVGLLGPDLADTWTFDGERWQLVNIGEEGGGGWKEQPGPRRGHAMAYDAARDQVLLFGGEFGGESGGLDVKFADLTWIHDGVQWSERKNGPFSRAFAAMADLPSSKVVVLFGGRTDKGASAETWIWNGQVWAKRDFDVAPSP
ncbi:MAG TPA: kelch repeat-containing protein, partial [Nannocystis sp.]